MHRHVVELRLGGARFDECIGEKARQIFIREAEPTALKRRVDAAVLADVADDVFRQPLHVAAAA